MPDVPYRYARTKKLLGQILKEMGAIHEGMVQEALAVQREEGGQIGQILIRLGHLDDATLQKGLARQAGIEMFDLAIIGILLYWLNQNGQTRQRIRTYKDEIDDFRLWESEEAAFRTVGNIKRLNRHKLYSINLAHSFLVKTNLKTAVYLRLIRNGDDEKYFFGEPVYGKEEEVEVCLELLTCPTIDVIELLSNVNGPSCSFAVWYVLLCFLIFVAINVNLS